MHFGKCTDSLDQQMDKKEAMSDEYKKMMAHETGAMTNTTIHNTFTKIRRVPVVLNEPVLFLDFQISSAQ